jgi:hypothetical protein
VVVSLTASVVEVVVVLLLEVELQYQSLHHGDPGGQVGILEVGTEEGVLMLEVLLLTAEVVTVLASLLVFQPSSPVGWARPKLAMAVTQGLVNFMLVDHSNLWLQY